MSEPQSDLLRGGADRLEPAVGPQRGLCDRREPGEPSSDSAFIRACRGEVGPDVPVWFMRQAGRSLPEYREIRRNIPMLESCTRPDLVVEITMQPVRRYGVDAAIFYSDIVVPLRAVGIDLDIVSGTGPVIADPIREPKDLERVRGLEADDVPYVIEAVRSLTQELGGTPLIGFAGAPFTLASYLIEGGPSRDHARTKSMMRSDPDLWSELLSRLARLAASFLRIQVESGASAVQLFDSWVGALSPADYERYVLPHSRALFAALADLDVPRIHFGVGTGEMLPQLASAGCEVVGVDWRVPLDVAAARVPGRALQGNLDPTLVFAPDDVLVPAVHEVVRAGRSASGHVFNLGHGVLPGSDPAALARIVDAVRTAPAAGADQSDVEA